MHITQHKFSAVITTLNFIFLFSLTFFNLNNPTNYDGCFHNLLIISDYMTKYYANHNSAQLISKKTLYYDVTID